MIQTLKNPGQGLYPLQKPDKLLWYRLCPWQSQEKAVRRFIKSKELWQWDREQLLCWWETLCSCTQILHIRTLVWQCQSAAIDPQVLLQHLVHRNPCLSFVETNMYITLLTTVQRNTFSSLMRQRYISSYHLTYNCENVITFNSKLITEQF